MFKRSLFVVLVLMCAALWAAPAAKGPYQHAVNLPVVGAEQQTYFGPAEESHLRPPDGRLDDPIGSIYLVGSTWYDYQHNGSAGKMIGMDNDGFAHFVWMKGMTSMVGGPRRIYYQVWDPTTQSMMFLNSGNMPTGVQVDAGARGGYACQAVMPGGMAFPGYHEVRNGISGNHSAMAIDFLPRLGAFTSTQPNLIYESGSPLELIWPKVAMGHDSVLHMVTTHSLPTAGAPQRIYYSRGIPQWDQDGNGMQIFWQNVAPGNLQYKVLDTAMTIAADVAASKLSSRVAIAYPRPRRAMNDSANQYDNDIYLITSNDGGLTWGPRVNLTQFTNQDTLRAYNDVSVLFDDNDVLHVAFTTGFYDMMTPGGPYISSQYSMIWHWDEQHNQFSPMARDWEFNSDGLVGAWQRLVQRPSLSQDEVTGYLYSSYQKYDLDAISEGGFYQGDAWITVSTDGGAHWSTGRNVTDTRPPIVPTPAGFCWSERDITLADRVFYFAGQGMLNLEYVKDADAGSIPQGEGVATDNYVYYHQVNVTDIPTTPLMPNFPFHNGQVPPPVVGRCCYLDPINPFCSMETEALCAQYGGVWDSTMTCDTPCPSSFECTCQNAPNSVCNLTGGPIGDFAPSLIPIHVPTQYHVTDVNVCLDITYPDDMDLVIQLLSPAGHVSTLASRQGPGGQGYSCTTFDDEALDSIPQSFPPFRGTFTPETPLSVFDGENAMGDWVLRISGAQAGDSGRVNWVCLSFQYDEILPVELASVSANPEQGGIRFRFATATENRNDHFELWRSASATGEFSRIASIRSQGNSSTAQQYSYLDADVVAGTTYS
ncbi:MAG TPA: proprotein convertase P-domain-containing protein, partial [bacterium]